MGAEIGRELEKESRSAVRREERCERLEELEGGISYRKVAGV